ncbi:GIY-YIG nuclease family protein [Burkholderia ubonensis]|uniref:GIY-YIG nuclease family protein n=1 Tax=Burkholderia ubonensis TaxID=101571 RepID=UPI0009B445F5
MWVRVEGGPPGTAVLFSISDTKDYNRFKIGRTTNNPLTRLKTLRTGDPYVAVEAAYFVAASRERLSQLEAAIHREFGGRIRFHDEGLSECSLGRPNRLANGSSVYSRAGWRKWQAFTCLTKIQSARPMSRISRISPYLKHWAATAYPGRSPRRHTAPRRQQYSNFDHVDIHLESNKERQGWASCSCQEESL